MFFSNDPKKQQNTAFYC